MKTHATGLYFTKGTIPTDEEKAEAKALGITAFRNSQLVDPDRAPEPAALVAGEVPAAYRAIKGQKIASRNSK